MRISLNLGSAASASMTAVNLGSSPATAVAFLVFGVFFMPALCAGGILGCLFNHQFLRSIHALFEGRQKPISELDPIGALLSVPAPYLGTRTLQRLEWESPFRFRRNCGFIRGNHH